MKLEETANDIVQAAYRHFTGPRDDFKDRLFNTWLFAVLKRVKESGNDKPPKNVLDSQEGKRGAESSVRYTPG